MNDFFDAVYDALGISYIAKLMQEKESKSDSAELSTTAQKLVTQAVAPVRYQYRPTTFASYIGQDKGKDKIKLTIELIKKGYPKHFLLTGNAGHGKTTMAAIIAKELGLNFVVYVGSAFDIPAMQDFLVKENEIDQPSMLFIDELAEVDKKTLTYMLPIIEDFKQNNVPVRRFIFCGATTDKYVVSRRCQPFIDRIACQVQLEDYNAEEIQTMLRQYNDQLYKANVTEEVYDLLSKNTRFCPRIALAYFDLLIGCEDIHKVLGMNRIVKEGLDDRDIKILAYLNNVGDRAVGEESLSIIANCTRAEYRELIEPYLMRQGLISRTNKGRILTAKGKIFLQGLNE